MATHVHNNLVLPYDGFMLKPIYNGPVYPYNDFPLILNEEQNENIQEDNGVFSETQ